MPAAASLKRHLGQTPSRASAVTGAPHFRQETAVFINRKAAPTPITDERGRQSKSFNENYPEQRYHSMLPATAAGLGRIQRQRANWYLEAVPNRLGQSPKRLYSSRGR